MSHYPDLLRFMNRSHASSKVDERYGLYLVHNCCNTTAVTTMSPVQFQKRLRLQEARRILYVRDSDAAAVSFRVGYASPSQFNRDYKSLFGSPPRKDVEHLRNVSGGMNAAPQELPPPYETGFAPRENEREAGVELMTEADGLSRNNRE